MKTFKQFLTENKKKKDKNKDLKISRGHEFGMAGAGKAGLMQADTKRSRKKKQRKEGKDLSRKYTRGDY